MELELIAMGNRELRMMSRAAKAKLLVDGVAIMNTDELIALRTVVDNELNMRNSVKRKENQFVCCSKETLKAIQYAAFGSLTMHIVGPANSGKSDLLRLYRYLGGRGGVFCSWYCPCGAATSADHDCGCMVYDRLQYVYSWDKFDVTIYHDLEADVRRYSIATLNDNVAVAPSDLSKLNKTLFTNEGKAAEMGISSSQKLSKEEIGQFKKLCRISCAFHGAKRVTESHVAYAAKYYRAAKIR